MPVHFLAGMNGEPIPYPEEPTNSGMRVLETYEIYVNSIICSPEALPTGNFRL